MMDVMEPELRYCGRTDKPTEEGNKWATINFVRNMRRLDWEKQVDWCEEDKMRMFTQHEMLPEDIQEQSSPMVIIGSDVVGLYPSLEVTRAAEIVKEAVIMSDMKFEGVDLMECARYVALNWTRDQCQASKLRRILPWRRKKTGTRPGIRGSGPRGKTRGDTEQWVFPHVVLEEGEKKLLVGTVLQIMVRALFSTHHYSFGGKIYHQRGGGPIGLRGTAAVARLIMQVFDVVWRARLEKVGIETWLLARYVDDCRALLQPFKKGWRYGADGLRFCQAWAEDDKDLTPTQVTKNVLAKTMEGIEGFLEFTYETCEDEGFYGWLPTLDTCIRVNKDNKVEYQYYEKPMVSTKTVQLKSAMDENSKMNILANDMRRRLLNTNEGLGEAVIGAVVDQYAVKLMSSGYGKEQTRKIIKNGIKGYERKKMSRMKRGLSLRSTAEKSMKDRYKKKLLEKSNWYKKRRIHENDDEKPNPRSRKPVKKEAKEKPRLEPKTILFVEHTRNGELATRLREATRRLEQTIGFGIRVVERAGAPLKNSFSVGNLWDNMKCGREDCVPCEQGAEKLQPCFKASVVYENVCQTCNPGAEPGKDQVEIRSDIPTIYVGETSRSLHERMREHWGANEKKKDNSHMFRHHLNEHGGGEEPKFMARIVQYHKSAPSRQLGEAVRIMRRGGQGSILNSKSEYDRCRIP